MEFNQIEIFIQVVKQRSFSKAAKEMFLTQPTISNNIQLLERELKTTLLDRKTKEISLTHSGRIFYHYAVDLINLRDQAQAALAEEERAMRGQMELEASSIPEQYILPYIIKDFTQLHPQVTFSVANSNSKDIVDAIFQGRLTYGIVGARYEARKLDYLKFFEDQLGLVVASQRYPDLDNFDSLPLEDFLKEGFIFRREGSGSRRLVEEVLEKEGISLEDLRVQALIDNNEMIKKMVELDLGVSLLSYQAVQKEVELGLVKVLQVEGLNFQRDFYFVSAKHRTLPPVVQGFRDFLAHWQLPPEADLAKQPGLEKPSK